jgi:hypothetical protein
MKGSPTCWPMRRSLRSQALATFRVTHPDACVDAIMAGSARTQPDGPTVIMKRETPLNEKAIVIGLRYVGVKTPEL